MKKKLYIYKLINQYLAVMFNIFRIKAKCKRFYDLSSSTFDLKGFNVDILGKFSISPGELKIDNYGHKEVSEELLQLDLYQYGLCQSINSISNVKIRDKQRIKIIDAQIKMMELVSKISEKVKPKEEKVFDNYNLVILFLNENGEMGNYHVEKFSLEVDTPVKFFLDNFPRLAKVVLNIELQGKQNLAFLDSKSWAEDNIILAAKPVKSQRDIAIIDEKLINQYQHDKGFLLTIAKSLLKL